MYKIAIYMLVVSLVLRLGLAAGDLRCFAPAADTRGGDVVDGGEREGGDGVRLAARDGAEEFTSLPLP
jgi:hypothetical protein